MSISALEEGTEMLERGRAQLFVPVLVVLLLAGLESAVGGHTVFLGVRLAAALLLVMILTQICANRFLILSYAFASFIVLCTSESTTSFAAFVAASSALISATVKDQLVQSKMLLLSGVAAAMSIGAFTNDLLLLPQYITDSVPLVLARALAPFEPRHVYGLSELPLAVVSSFVFAAVGSLGGRSRWKVAAVSAVVCYIAVVLAVVYNAPWASILIAVAFFSLVPAPRFPNWKRGVVLGAVTSAVLFVGVLLVSQLPRRSDESKMPRVIGVMGGDMVDFSSPDPLASIGAREPSFFGFESALRDYGMKVTRLRRPLTLSALKTTDVAVFINTSSYYSTEELDAIDRYIREGGRVMMLADHTDIGGVQGPFNQVAKSYGASLNYDSAIGLADENTWNGAVRFSYASSLLSRGGAPEMHYGVGASLTTNPAWTPILVGTNGFSDKGNPSYGLSHLGNMNLDRGERIGTLELVSRRSIGEGALELWGDTACFQSGSMVSSHSLIVSAVVDLATCRRQSQLAVFAAFGLLAAVACACVLQPKTSWILCIPFVLAIHATYVYSKSSQLSHPRTASAVLDSSHGMHWPKSGTQSSPLKTWETFASIDKPLYAITELDDALACNPSILVISSPAQDYSQNDAKLILAFVGRGGHLILCLDPSSANRMRRVLDKLGIVIDAYPLGAAHSALLTDRGRDVLGGHSTKPALATSALYHAPKFVEAWRIGVSNNSDTDILVTTWGHPIVAETRYSKGLVHTIADPRFLSGGNFGLQTGRLENVKFLKALLDR